MRRQSIVSGLVGDGLGVRLERRDQVVDPTVDAVRRQDVAVDGESLAAGIAETQAAAVQLGRHDDSDGRITDRGRHIDRLQDEPCEKNKTNRSITR